MYPLLEQSLQMHIEPQGSEAQIFEFGSARILCGLIHMASSKVLLAKRALLKLLLALALAYGVALSVTRDSVAAEVLKAFRRPVLKTHPDKGGSKADTQEAIAG